MYIGSVLGKVDCTSISHICWVVQHTHTSGFALVFSFYSRSSEIICRPFNRTIYQNKREGQSQLEKWRTCCCGKLGLPSTRTRCVVHYKERQTRIIFFQIMMTRTSRFVLSCLSHWMFVLSILSQCGPWLIEDGRILPVRYTQ